MDLKGEYLIPAPKDKVWEELNNPESLKNAIKGCETLDKISDTEFNAKVKAKIGPVSAIFNGSVTLTEINPPNSYVISGQGKGGAAGFAKGTVKIVLTEDEDKNKTKLAISSALPNLFIGIFSKILFFCLSFNLSVIGEEINPGEIMLTLIFLDATSSAKDLYKPTIPDFDDT